MPTKTTAREHVYVGVGLLGSINLNNCGACGEPAYRYGFGRVHMHCTVCDWDTAKFCPSGALAPSPEGSFP